jgi:SAM-dependent methyltransferase
MAEIVEGNYYDKYGSRNPLTRLLVRGFQEAVRSLLAGLAPRSVLDAGAGEGQMTAVLREILPAGARIVASDISLRTALGARDHAPGIDYVLAAAEALPFPAETFDLVCAFEMLEHLADPERGLAELLRVTRRHLLVSVPWEPVWRGMNMLRGAYWSELGNTPGHLQHWTRAGFVRFVGRQATVLEVRRPFPWTMVLAVKGVGAGRA